MSMLVLQPGLQTTVQDLGRSGFQKFGVVVGGPMDPFAFRAANLLVGNEPGAAGLEISLQGPTLVLESDHLLAVCGGNLGATLDGEEIPLWRPVWARSGSIITFGRALRGYWAYLAVAGGIQVPSVLGSASTLLRAGFGGLEGRALRKNDCLQFGVPSEVSQGWAKQMQSAAGDRTFQSVGWKVSYQMFPEYDQHPVIRVLEGTEFQQFAEETRNRFLSETFRLTPQSDRMGYRLEGPRLEMEQQWNMISDAVTIGTIQVPPHGQPIVLMADRQTSGGYPRIAQVATVDLPVLAQLRPGASLRFRRISQQEAQMRYLLAEWELDILKRSIMLQMSV